jgi:DNA-binding protein
MAEKTRETNENVIYIGNKSPMSYVLAVVTQFNSGAEKVHIKARGKAISRAVDVAEIVKNRFMPNTTADNIQISTEPIETKEGDTINVSAISITLAR